MGLSRVRDTPRNNILYSLLPKKFLFPFLISHFILVDDDSRQIQANFNVQTMSNDVDSLADDLLLIQAFWQFIDSS